MFYLVNTQKQFFSCMVWWHYPWGGIQIIFRAGFLLNLWFQPSLLMNLIIKKCLSTIFDCGLWKVKLLLWIYPTLAVSYQISSGTWRVKFFSLFKILSWPVQTPRIRISVTHLWSVQFLWWEEVKKLIVLKSVCVCLKPLDPPNTFWS